MLNGKTGRPRGNLGLTLPPPFRSKLNRSHALTHDKNTPHKRTQNEQNGQRLNDRFTVEEHRRCPQDRRCSFRRASTPSRASALETPHSTNETGATNCYIQKTEVKHADRHEDIDAMKWRLEHRAEWG